MPTEPVVLVELSEPVELSELVELSEPEPAAPEPPVVTAPVVSLLELVELVPPVPAALVALLCVPVSLLELSMSDESLLVACPQADGRQSKNAIRRMRRS